MKPHKPILIFDGDCGFCRTWIERWKNLTLLKVDYEPYQRVGNSFPQIQPSQYESAVHLIEPNGEISVGAKAVFKVLTYSPTLYRYGYWLYRKVPFFSFFAEKAYAVVAKHRTKFSWLTRVLWGESSLTSTYNSSSKIFIKILAVVFFTAFFSMFLQSKILFRADGFSPTAEYLQDVKSTEGALSYYLFPTLSWINSSDWFLVTMCLAGMLSSVFVLFNLMAPLGLFLCWYLYLSLCISGGEFFFYQWDTFLLEAGFLSIFLNASRFHPRFVFLMKLLLFKLMFLSGIAKLKSGDLSWRDLTALSHHFETQPLPTWFSWYAHQLPEVVLKFFTGTTLFIEIIVPVFFFFPRRLRFVAFLLHSFLQVMIILTGNYCFFNILALGMGLFLIDDTYFDRRTPLVDAFSNNSWTRYVALPVLVIELLCIISSKISYPVYSIVSPLRTFNRYALFSVMTTVRDEIVIEGSLDGVKWTEYDFRYKPGDLKKRPGFNIPGQPRVDWQMWFASFNSFENNPWLQKLMYKLLKNDELILSLFETNPFKEKPPRYVRAKMWQYEFTTLEEKKATNAWWKRSNERPYSPILSFTSVD